MPVRSTRESVKNAIRTRWLRARKPDVVDVEGVRLALDGAWATPLVRKALYSRWYEDAELRILAERLRPDDRVLEVGTGLGVVTTAACRIVGPEAVVSYDANPEIVAVARATAAANGFTPKIVHGVLGDESGETTFYLHSDFWTSSLEPNADARPVTVPKLSLDAEIAVHRPSFLMLDMEGGEIELLDGYELPAYVRAICMETHPQATGTAALQALLSHLIAQGFALDLGISGEDIAYFERTA